MIVCKIKFLLPNLVAYILQKDKKRSEFQQSCVNLQRAKYGTRLFDAKYRYV